jgi:hypothetical protein
MGFPKPLLTAITPVIKVVATAPIPGVKIPSRPSAGFMLVAELIKFKEVYVFDFCLMLFPHNMLQSKIHMMYALELRVQR